MLTVFYLKRKVAMMIHIRYNWHMGIRLLLTLSFSLLLLSSIPVFSATAHADDGIDSPTGDCSSDGYGFDIDGLQLLLTAGHCPTDQTTYWQQYSQGIDAQLKVVDGSISNTFQVSGSDPISVVGIISTDDLANAQAACTLGGTGVLQCGSILRQDYAPSYVASRTASFLLVDTPCQAGDSGSPWFLYNNSINGWQAVGITSGRVNATGQCIVDPLPAIVDAANNALNLGDSLQLNDA